MEIIITWGLGVGKTELAAFDKALHEANIGDFNLIKLTSIIPPRSTISLRRYKLQDIKFGHKAYVVLSSGVETRPEHEIWAGLGWLTEKKSSRGIIVEQKGGKREQVIRKIKDTLLSMRSCRPYLDSEIEYKVIGGKCKDWPICALVCAVFDVEGWRSKPAMFPLTSMANLKKRSRL